MSNAVHNAYAAGAYDALEKLGFEKEAWMLPAARTIGTSLARGLKGLGTATNMSVKQLGGAYRGAGINQGTVAQAGQTLGRGVKALGQGVQQAGRQAVRAVQQNAPGLAKGVQTAGKVLTHPATQVAAVAAPAVM